jgi:hypothetical protein
VFTARAVENLTAVLTCYCHVCHLASARWNETGYRTSECPSIDSQCWIYVFARVDKATYAGWLPVEQPNTPGVCGTPDGGVKYAVPTASVCPKVYLY